MQINNINTNTNFGAYKIASAKKLVQEGMKYEKLDVYKIDEIQDMPFLRKIIKFMDSKRKFLNNEQQKMLSELKIFIEKWDNYFGGISGKYETMYISIKNDETITGVMRASSKPTRGGKFHNIENIISTTNDDITNDALTYGIFCDKSLSRDFVSDFACTTKFNRYTKLGSKKKIRDRHPDYEISTSAQSKPHNLEEILDIQDNI